VNEAATRGSGLARAAGTLDRLHPTAISDPREVQRLLERLLLGAVPLRRGMNRRIDPEKAWLDSIQPDGLLLRIEDFEPDRRELIFLNFALDQHPYFFAVPFEADLPRGRMRVGLPSAIYRAERRSRTRRVPGDGDAHRVALQRAEDEWAEADVAEASPEGMSVCVPSESAEDLGQRLRVRLLDGARAGSELHAEVRSRAPIPERTGWTRIGLDVSPSPRSEDLQVERRARVIHTTATERAQRRWKVVSAGLRVATDRALSALGRQAALPDVHTVDYKNDDGEQICAIVDSWGDTRGATAVVIPPAWGRTKETLMPLAATLLAGFRAAREPVVVVRFDGIRKRGESHNDPDCRGAGKDHHRFTFTQGVRDIRTTVDFLERSEEFRPRKVVLVSFSAASIESRRAVATDPRIDGWVCVVGASDTQSMMKVISGGIDYGLGFERGARFGLQEILGIEVDMDHAGLDAVQGRLAFLEDARRDMTRISVPVTWIHGRHDAWMDGAKARDILSRGDTRLRRFLEVPTGHMLRSSREALETFQLITAEVGRMALSREMPRAIPSLGALDRRRQAERARIGAGPEDVKEFWCDYLVGRDGSIGIELMTNIRAYRELMQLQISELEPGDGDVVVDLGSGTGALPLVLADLAPVPERLSIVQLDFVRAGLLRCRSRLEEHAAAGDLPVGFVEANLDGPPGVGVPLRSGSCDAAVASLVLGYLDRPEVALAEIRYTASFAPGGDW
jgi:hypothetical protein